MNDRHHIRAVYQHVLDGPQFEMPIGVVNRLLEAAAEGKFEWPATLTAHRMQEELVWVMTHAESDETVDYEAASALVRLGVRAKQLEV